MSLVKEKWGEFGLAGEEKVEVFLYTLRSKSGIEAKITNFGATIVGLRVPDRKGEEADVVLGLRGFSSYAAGEQQNFGAFSIDDKEYELARNNGPNHLHGGPTGFWTRVFACEEAAADAAAGSARLRLSYVSKDGEEGYPGELTVQVTYELTAGGELRMDMRARTSAPTVVNLCNHAYWNLAGHQAGSVLDHRLFLNASRYLPVDATLIPTGELAPVSGTPLDFTKPTLIGARLDAFKDDKAVNGGYDHCFVLDRQDDGKSEAGKAAAAGGSEEGLVLAARLEHPGSGRVMEVLTTAPGLQVYTGNFLDGSTVGKGGVAYGKHAAVCLETQAFPNSPNMSEEHREAVVLRPGQEYRHVVVHRFSVAKEEEEGR